ncbi:hypothetical protein BC941DRAFT_431039 [Chlamydoabsidia padenii]|nr:hypothetical protein BC941DRAFT_431039 [Chlamydoabsidia padenii]
MNKEYPILFQSNLVKKMNLVVLCIQCLIQLTGGFHELLTSLLSMFCTTKESFITEFLEELLN